MRVFKNTVFFAILIGLMVIVSSMIETKMISNDTLVQNRNKSLFRIMREPENSIDVLVVGDSLSYTSMSPMQAFRDSGMSMYVCGQSGQKMVETHRMIETAFETQSPKVVLIETNAIFRGKGGISDLKEKVEDLGNYYLPILRNHDIWKSVFLNKKYKVENYKGFSFRTSVQPYKGGAYMLESTEEEKIPDSSIEYLRQIVELCENNGAKLLLFSSPSPDNYSYERYNSLKRFTTDTKIDYLDLNHYIPEIGINWNQDSLDKGDHLNLSGAEKVTKYMTSYLKVQYDLPDHRNDNNYKEWNTELEQYLEKANKYLDAIRSGDTNKKNA